MVELDSRDDFAIHKTSMKMWSKAIQHGDNLYAAYACMCMFWTKVKFLYFQRTELYCIVLKYKHQFHA